RLVLAAGRRLASSGALAQPEDVFFLRAEELKSALRRQSPTIDDIVERRRQEMARGAKITPPEFIGAPPAEPQSSDGPPDRFWGARLRSDRPGELKGNAPSARIARGPARVLATLDEAERFNAGDVLVTRTTMPPWTPLFAVASAVITETGGVLSHAAVTARSSALPARISVSTAS